MRHTAGKGKAIFGSRRRLRSREPILTEDNITIKQDPEKMQDCANRLAPVLKVFVYKLVGETWTKVEDVNLNTAYDEAKANPDEAASGNTAKETNNTYMTAMLPAQGTATYVIAGYLPETVNNAYQGQHFHGKLVLNAYQMDDTGAASRTRAVPARPIRTALMKM